MKPITLLLTSLTVLAGLSTASLAFQITVEDNKPKPKSGGKNTCAGKRHQSTNNWKVVIQHDSKYDTSGCGRGFLDNYRGECGDITNWVCNLTDDAAHMTFLTDTSCTGEQISAAILVASKEEVHIKCPLKLTSLEEASVMHVEEMLGGLDY